MADMMTFPDTVEEFMEEYKLVDTEQVYTNGMELVPMFRMKQWFEHEKAQLSQEGTTSDLISRQAAIDAIEKMNIPEDMCVFEILSHIEVEIATLPTIQPVATDTNVGDTISRQAVLDAIVQCTNCGDEDTLREYVLKHSLDNGWTGGILEALDAVKDLPPARPEREEGEWVQIQRCVGDTQPDLECPFCKHRIGWWDMGRYCAGCGAKLEGGAG